MATEAFLDKDVQDEIALRDARILELEMKVRDWQRWYECVAADFVGLTSDPQDPSKVHDWEWMDDYRPAPLRMDLPTAETVIDDREYHERMAEEEYQREMQRTHG